MVISTGMVVPFISLVRSLNCITNWPILTPCCPSAGPTGGAGVAWPPGHCNFTFAVITFAIVRLSHARGCASDPFPLPVFQVHRGIPIEDDQHDLDQAAALDDLL